MKKLSFIILVLIILSQNIFAQRKYIGVDLGIGKSGIHGNQLANYFQLGLSYNFQPIKAPFEFKTGFNYDFRCINKTNLSYFKVPLGLNFIIGKRFNFIIGGGLSINYLFLYRKTENISNFNETFQRFQLGSEVYSGFTYQISNKYKICLIPQINFDLSKIYDEPDYTPGGAYTPYAVKGVDFYIKISLRYQLNTLNGEMHLL